MHTPCGVRKGAWSEEEDNLLRICIAKYGEGRWHLVPSRAGLSRCRKSCRLRWLNYLRPDIKRGDFSSDEVDLIFRLHKLLGNRWSLIAGRLPGRTANDVKNYWNTHLVKKMADSSLRMKLGEGKPPVHINRSVHSTNPTASRTGIVKPRPRTFSKNTGWQIKKKTAISAEAPRTMEEMKDSTPPQQAPAPVKTDKDASNNTLPSWLDNRILSVERESTTWPYFDGGFGALENGMTSLCPGETSNLQEGAKDCPVDCNQEGQFGSSFFSIDPEFWDLNFYS